MWKANGVIVQGINDKTNFVKNFSYQGLHAYYSYPLTDIRTVECRRLTVEQQSKEVGKNEYVSLEFISNADLFDRYMKKCNELEIPVRVLWVESGYSNEIWEEELPAMAFLGYEYSPIPMDEQIITDLDLYSPFSSYWKILNQYGLFETYEEIKGFVETYNKVFVEGRVGDGEMDTYICRVYEVII